MSVVPASAAASPFAIAAPDLIAGGFMPLTIMPPSVMHHSGAGKAPAEFVSGSWRGMPGWAKYRETTPSTFQMGLWMKAPGAGVGVLTGTPAGVHPKTGDPMFFLALDIDTDGDALDDILRCIPPSPWEKRGNVGLTRGYRAPASIVSQSFDRTATADAKASRLVDVLAAGRQCVVPPSRHKLTGKPYIWTGSGPVPAHELPVFDEDNLAMLIEVLETLGYEPEAKARRSDSAEPRMAGTPGSYASDFEEANGEGLARADEWFPALELPRTRRTRVGWSAVPVWRDSNSGRPLETRKLNLSLSTGTSGAPAGIRDWGASGSDANMTCIDLVMRALDLDAVGAMEWLREKLALDHSADSVIIDLSRPPPETTTAPRASAEEAHEAGPNEKVGREEPKATILNPVQGETHGALEMPAHLLRVPGLVGHIAEWITATSRKPQPVLSLAAALGVVGTVAGRKFAGPTDSATHLYFLCTAPTGAGKNAPKKAAAQLLQQAGMRPLLGPGSFSSGSALVQHVSRHPASLCVMDEFGVFIGKLNTKNNSTHERAISGEMRQFWTLSFEDYQPPCWANSATRQTLPPIPAPALSIMGLTTPDELYSVLQGADVLSGFLNRFTLFATASNPPDRDPAARVFDVPQQLIDGLRSIAESVSPLEAATMHGAGSDTPPRTIPWEGGPDGEARAVFRALQVDMETRTDNEAMRQRTAEMAVRMATIIAIGVSGASAQVSAEDMRWGAAVATWSTERLIADIAEHMVESDHQMRAKMVLRIINAAPGRTITRTELCRQVNHRFDGRTLDAVVAGLMDAGQVGLKEMSASGPGRRPKVYRAL